MKSINKVHSYRIENVVDDKHRSLYVYEIDSRTVVLTSNLERANKYLESEFDKLLLDTSFERYEFRAVEDDHSGSMY